MSQLNPPILDAVLPAAILYHNESNNYYLENIPFELNYGVDSSQISKIKVYINDITNGINYKIIDVDTSNFTINTTLRKGTIDYMDLGTSPNINVGNYYSIQLAFLSNSDTNNVIIKSNSAVIKITAEPTVVLQGGRNNDCPYSIISSGNLGFLHVSGGEPIFKIKLVYSPPSDDLTEFPYKCMVHYQYQDAKSPISTIEKKEIFWNNGTNYIFYTLPGILFNEMNTPINTYWVDFDITTINGLTLHYGVRIHNDWVKTNTNAIATTLDHENAKLTLKARENNVFYFKKYGNINNLYYNTHQSINNLNPFIDYNVQLFDENLFIRCFDEDDKIYYTAPILQFNYSDIFLYDGEKQLCLKYDPKVTTFKTTLQETKIDTLGGQYPTIIRNGHTNYKEFQISATLSYLTDENEMFISKKELFGKKSYFLERDTTNADDDTYFPPMSSTNLTNINLIAEKKFREKVLAWLNNGEVKLLKSPTEGNMLVRLMNVSLTPNDTLGRMIYSFSATVYEVAENTPDNLIKYNLM